MVTGGITTSFASVAGSLEMDAASDLISVGDAGVGEAGI